MLSVSTESGIRRATRLAGCCVALVVTLAAPVKGFAESPSAAMQNEAKHALDLASEAYDHGRFAAALEAYEHSYQLRPLPKTLLGMARAAEGAGQPERARESYQTYLRTYPNAPNRKQIEARMKGLSAAAAAPAAAPAATVEPVQRAQPDPKSLPSLTPQLVPPRGELSFLPTEEILARQRSLQLRLTTRDGLSLGAPITLLVLGLVTAGAGGGLVAASIDKYNGTEVPVAIAGAALASVGAVTAITGGAMLGIRRSRARGIRRALASMNDELRGRQPMVSVTPFASTKTAGLTGTVRF